MNVSAWFIHRPVATLLLTLTLVLLGALAFWRLPVASLPQAEFPTLRISASLSGASPDTMATAVATPLENELSGIAGIKEMTSTSTQGSTSITVQFELDKKLDQAIQEVQAALNSAQRDLPAEMTSPPTWRKVNPADAPVLILNVYSPDLPLTTLSDLVDTQLARQLAQIQGVGEVNIFGQQRPALWISADPVRLAAHGLTLADLRQRIAQASQNQPKGTLYGARQTTTLEANDQLTQPRDYANLVLRDVQGQQLRLGDVARVEQRSETPYVYAEQNGRRGLNLSISRQPDANVVQTVDRVMAALPGLQASLPASVDISVLNDRTRTIRTTLHEVEITLLLTMALVVAVMALFLRQWSATLVVAAVLAVSLVATFAGMAVLGFSLNNLSLMALIIATGFVVDDAIVVVENIHRHQERGLSALQAALTGSREIGFTVISISLSLIAVFIPLLFMEGILGRLFREFALTLSLAVLVSIAVSLSLAPMLLARFGQHVPPQSQSGWLARLTAAYGRFLQGWMRRPWLGLGVFAATLGLTVLLFLQLPRGFIPEQDTGFLQGTTRASQETISFADMVQAQKALAAIVARDPDVASYAFSVGSTGGSQSLSTGRFMITLKPRRERQLSAQQWAEHIKPQLAAVRAVRLSLKPAQELNLGVGSGRSSYQLTLTATDPALLRMWAGRLSQAMQQQPVLTEVNSELRLGGVSTMLSFDRQEAARYGLSVADLDAVLYDAFGLRRVGGYQTALGQYRILLTVDERLPRDRSLLSQLVVRSPVTGGLVPLDRVARLLPDTATPAQIDHAGLYPATTISFNVRPGAALGDATAAIARLQQQLQNPPEVRLSYSGSAQAFLESLQSQPWLILAALLAVYVILGVLYEDWRDPLVILSTLPSAGLGALLALWLGGFPLDVMALIGLLLLIGIVKKNGILLVDFARVAHQQGMDLSQAAVAAAVERFRPILMTTLAALLGALPLILSVGEGSELRRPLGVAVVGGLLLSQVLTLLTTPVLYVWLNRALGARLRDAGQTDR